MTDDHRAAAAPLAPRERARPLTPGLRAALVSSLCLFVGLLMLQVMAAFMLWTGG